MSGGNIASLNASLLATEEDHDFICRCAPVDVRFAISEIERLKQAVRILYTGTLQGHANHWDACGTHGANCPACLFAARQREAAVEVLGRVPECEYVPEAEGGES